MTTTATSHRSKATLQDVALSHARSRALSGETREIFQHIANGETRLTLTDDHGLAYSEWMIHDAFFEAATSCATRAGQSYSRRVMCSDLMALRTAVLANESVRPAVYDLHIKVTGDPDLFRAALLNLDRDDVRVVFASNPSREA